MESGAMLAFVFLPEDFCGTLADDDVGSHGIAAD
jgi:hypothetical protein